MTGGERRAAIGVAAGAISMCWDPTPEGVFESDRAVQIADDLADYLDIEPNMSAEEGAWILTLVQQSIPRSPNDPSVNWEGRGREYAERILSRVANSGPSDLEKRHTALITELKGYDPDPEAPRLVEVDWILNMLGEAS